MRTPGLAEFPDCVAARSTKHLRELAARVEAGDRAVVLFVVQREDCPSFGACHDLDPEFAATLLRVAEQGVGVLVYACEMNTAEILIKRPIAWLR